MYKKILVPISSQSNMKLIVDFLNDFLDPRGEITLLYIITSDRLPISAVEWRRAMTVISETNVLSVSMGINVNYRVKNSPSVASGILDESAMFNYDLIFFANSTYKRGPRRIFGTKIDEVVRKSHTETIVLSYLEDKPIKYDRILIPTSGYRHALRATNIAEVLAKKYGSEVTVLYVGDPSSRAEADTILSQVTTDLNANNVKNHALFRSGPVAETILDESKQGYDLMMIGATERPREYEFLLGSTADKVVRDAPCHVLIVKTVDGR